MRRILGNYQDVISRSTSTKDAKFIIIVIFFGSQLSLFSLLGNLAFFNSSPIISKDWTTAYFEQFKSLGIKHHSLGFSTIYCPEKITTPCKLIKK